MSRTIPRACLPARLRQHAPLAAAIAAALLSTGAQALEIDTGNPDLSVRWDNTVRANLATRVESRDPKIGNSAIADEGTYSFDKGDMVAQRLDLLSEFDLVYRKRFGARVSATAWQDAVRATAALEEEVQRYARFLWDHMGREEGVILPAAQAKLLPQDWAEIDAAFAASRDPQFDSGDDAQYRQLFSRIVNLSSS